MTNREILLATRAIVADGDPLPNREGCLEDGLCRTLHGVKWHSYEAVKYLDALEQHPAYKLLLAEAQKRQPWFFNRLWSFNDNVTKPERLALIDAVIDSL